MTSLSTDIYKVLVVDDEQDMISVTRLGLKGMAYAGRSLELLSTDSGEGAVNALREDPNIAVVLLDVVMENNRAGLDACKTIREELGNTTVRILLRTGQPGAAPEKETIEAYDIDGYLPKAEMTSVRLYSAVRTALKAWEELMELQRHRNVLSEIHQLALSLHSYETLNSTLQRLAGAVSVICPAPLTVMMLEDIDTAGDAATHILAPHSMGDQIAAQAATDEIVKRFASTSETRGATGPAQLEDGIYVPLNVHRGLGRGWIFLKGAKLDDLSRKALDLLAAHAGNALYSTIAQRNLEARDSAVFEETGV